MLPLLKIAADQNEHNQREVRDLLAQKFHLTEIEIKEMLPSGKQARFDNRVAWARAYLKRAGLIENTGRGIFRITQQGLDLLGKSPERIDIKLLKQYPGILEWHGGASKTEDDESAATDATDQRTPEEILEASYQELRHSLAHELLERVSACSPGFFENLVIDLVVAMGYGGSRKDAGEAVGRSGDGGIDGIIKEDKLGLDVVYLQAKRWNGTVGRPVVQAFAGSLEGQRAKKGIMITTSKFSEDAKDYVSRIEKKIVLIDGD